LQAGFILALSLLRKGLRREESLLAFTTRSPAPIAFGAPYPVVFRVAGTAAFMSYGLGPVVNSIWKGQPWSVTLKEIFDGLVYGMLTAGTFGWLWPR
jgi:hypothetical protein